MKTISGTLLLAAVAVSTVYAEHGEDKRHLDLHQKEQNYPAYAAKPSPPPESMGSSCGCYTYTTTWYGAPTLVPDLGEYEATTSAGWETVAPAATSASSIKEELIDDWHPRRKGDSSSEEPAASTSEQPAVYEAPAAYIKKVSTTASSATVTSSAKSEPSSYAQSSSYVEPSPSSTSSSAAPSSTSANSTISSNGDKWAFCYTPYASDGTCKSAETVASDVAGIKAKGFTAVRLYATDCSGPQNVGAAAAKEGLKLILGIWVDESGIGSNTDAQVDELTAWGKDQWELVEMVVAGNEAMFYGYTSAEGLATFVNDVRTKFRAAGFQGPVGTSEVTGSFAKYADILCPAVDYAGANIHPFFNTDVSAEGAGDFVSQQLDDLAKACGGDKQAYNLESGWPSLGSANGMAVPGAEDQKIAIDSIMKAAGGRTAIFSYENDDWKAPGEFGVEQHWGCKDLFD